MAGDYVCQECGQRSEDDYCPICESKKMDWNSIEKDEQVSYEDNDDDAEIDDFSTMDDFDLMEFEEELPNAA